MKLADLVEALGLEVKSAQNNLANQVTGAYISDLLSDVIANSAEGVVWLTLQAHVNVVAVAVMKDLAGIILVNGREPQQDTVEKAETEGIPLMVSSLPTFELAGRLYDLGVRSANVKISSEHEGT